MNEEAGRPAALALELTAPAKAQTRDARTWLFSLSELAAERFNAALQRELDDLCQSVADRLSGSAAGLGRLPMPDAAASLHFSRPVFQHRFTTAAGKRKRSSSAGVWRIFYALVDKDGDGRPDTLSVLSLRHGGAAPLAPLADESDDDDDHEEKGEA